MSKITIIYDTKTEEIMAMEDGKTIAGVTFAAFDKNDGATVIGEDGILVANRSQCRPGESMEDCRKRVGSSYKSKASPELCRDGESMEDCKKRLGKTSKASPMNGDMGLMEKKIKGSSVEDLIKEKTGGLRNTGQI